MLVSLIDVVDEALHGGKAAQLGGALRAGLPVPPGFGLCHVSARAVRAARQPLSEALNALGGLCAVRSSAVGEDAAGASFAGQYATVLGVRSEAGLHDALAAVLDSARTEAAIGYRCKLGLDPHARMGVVIQKLIRSDVAGVLFTRNPIDGADERVIEASWGLGEAVVQGLVVPDHFRVARGGALIELTAGEKDTAIYWADAGGTQEREVEAAKVTAPCLSQAQLKRLDALATRCEQAFGLGQDLEFAFEGDALFLLQRRAITRG